MINSLTNYTGNVFLTGFMASGKTTLGRELANYLDFTFLDLDTEIQIGERSTISEIFKQKGEEYFRRIESDYLRSIPLYNRTIIALGGGCFINEANKDYILTHGKTIFVDVPYDVIWMRLEGDSNYRPLASYKDKNMLKSLYDQRYNAYLSSHKRFIFNNKYNKEEEIEYILKLLN